jgi:hypothetical protein
MKPPIVGQTIRVQAGNDAFDEQCVDSVPNVKEHNTGWNFTILTKREYVQFPQTEYNFILEDGGSGLGYVASIQKSKNHPDMTRVTFYTLILDS